MSFGMNYGNMKGKGAASGGGKSAGPGLLYPSAKGASKGKTAASWDDGAEEAETWDEWGGDGGGGAGAWGGAPSAKGGSWGAKSGSWDGGNGGAKGPAKGPAKGLAKGAASGPGMNYRPAPAAEKGAWGAASQQAPAKGASKGGKGGKSGKNSSGELVMNGETNWKPTGDGMVYQAISEAVAAMGHLETEWDTEKLEKKLREYFNKAGKNMEFVGTLSQLVGQYADNAISSIYAGLGDREWLFSGEVDFLLVLDAGIKDYFPGFMLRSVSQQDFEQLVLSNYERAFDEQRFQPILSEKVPEVVSGPKTKKKVWNAVNDGRKDAWQEGHTELDGFARSWISNSAKRLAKASGGSPEDTLKAEEMTQLILALFEAGALPTALMQNAEAPVGIVEEAVFSAFGNVTPDSEPAAKRLKGVFASWGPANYGGKGQRLFATKSAVAAKVAEAEAAAEQG